MISQLQQKDNELSFYLSMYVAVWILSGSLDVIETNNDEIQFVEWHGYGRNLFHPCTFHPTLFKGSQNPSQGWGGIFYVMDHQKGVWSD